MRVRDEEAPASQFLPEKGATRAQTAHSGRLVQAGSGLRGEKSKLLTHRNTQSLLSEMNKAIHFIQELDEILAYVEG